MVTEHIAARPVTHTDPNYTPAYLARPPGWMPRGVCAQAPVQYRDQWFDTPGSTDNKDARTACLSCPVIKQCAAFAVEAEMTHGTWGGMSETELRRCVKLVKDHRAQEQRVERARRREAPRCHQGHELTETNRTENNTCLTCYQAANLTRHGRYKHRQRVQRIREESA